MAIKIGISGFGRISRVVIRAAMDHPEIEIAGINIRNADIEYLEYMLRYDSTFGRFPKPLDHYDKGLIINGKKVPVYSFDDAKDIPWSECGAEYIIEGTGAYRTAEAAKIHIENGAKKVIITAPAKDDVTPMYVMGVNHEEYDGSIDVVSNASCTTNCLAPLVKVVHDKWGVKEGLMSTIHAATSKQKVVDARNMGDWRVGRSVFGNIIPTTTGAAKAVGRVIPDLAGKLTGNSYRVPTADVSIVDVNLVLENDASTEEIRQAMKEASETNLKGILEYVDDEVVTIDFVGDPHTSIFDARQVVELHPKYFKLVAYYDNEYGYSAKTLELIKYMYEVDNK